MGVCWRTSSSARRLSPSTFCVMSVKDDPGAIVSLKFGKDSRARTSCAAFGDLANALCFR